MSFLDAPTEWDGKIAIPIDTWRVVDRWWTDDPIDRVYVELELETSARIVIFKEGEGEWQKHTRRTK